MDLLTFHKAINPSDEPIYTPLRNGKTVGSRLTPRSLKQMTEIAREDTLLELGLVIPANYMIIETKDKLVIDVIIDRQENLFVWNTPEGYRILGQSFYDKTTTNNTLACGVLANTIVSNRTKQTVVLPFKTKNSTSVFLTKYEKIYSGKSIGFFPEWLEPIHKQSRPDQLDALRPPYSNFDEVIKKLNHLNVVTREQVINVINKHFMHKPLTDDELTAVIKNANYINNKIFFDGNVFLHNVLGEYLITKCNIKRDRKTKLLFLYNENQKIYENNEDYLIGYMTRMVPTLKDYQKAEVLKYINSYLVMDPVDFNQDPYSVVFKNGILDVLTMEFEQMDETHLETIRLDVNYNPNAKHQTADDFFETATQGDKQIQQLLFEAIGYSMLKTNELQSAFILVGDGRNGKSTYLDVIRAVLGRDNTTSISFKDLANNFRAASLDGKLASLAGDISSTPISDSDMIKSIIAGEEVMIERKYKDAYTHSMFATMFFSANNLPHTPDTSEGFYRRFPIIPFEADLSKVSRVDGASFRRNLLSQKSLDYIAYKAVVAINRVLEETKEFTMPDAVKEMVRQYKIENSSMLAWFEDVHHSDPRQVKDTQLRELYYHYEEWCHKNNYKPFRLSRFEKDFIRHTRMVLDKYDCLKIPATN